jgi:hypothetical protein
MENIFPEEGMLGHTDDTTMQIEPNYRKRHETPIDKQFSFLNSGLMSRGPSLEAYLALPSALVPGGGP